MINNRTANTGTPGRKMTGAKALAAAIVLTIAGASAANACTGTLRIVNQTQSDLNVYDLFTENKNGSWTYNLSWPTGIYLKANETKTRALNTTRKKSREFRVKAKTNVGTLYSNAATCSQGWTITAR
jgi:hypothetical protein